MPLLTSPIDGSPMRQIHRYGIEIDICPTSGGVWLDKGELEKIMQMIQEDMEGRQSQHFAPPQHQQAPMFKKYDDDDDDDYKKYHQKGYYGSGKYHKKSKMSRVMDLFDF